MRVRRQEARIIDGSSSQGAVQKKRVIWTFILNDICKLETISVLEATRIHIVHVRYFEQLVEVDARLKKCG